MKIHELKTHPGPFGDLWSGVKRFEVRKNDRGFEVGEGLHLREWDPETETKYPNGYTGRDLWALVQTILPGGSYGLPADLCVLGVLVFRDQKTLEAMEGRELFYRSDPTRPWSDSQVLAVDRSADRGTPLWKARVHAFAALVSDRLPGDAQSPSNYLRVQEEVPTLALLAADLGVRILPLEDGFEALPPEGLETRVAVYGRPWLTQKERVDLLTSNGPGSWPWFAAYGKEVARRGGT